MGKLGSGSWEPRWPSNVDGQTRLELELLARLIGEVRALSTLQVGYDPPKHDLIVQGVEAAVLDALWLDVETEAVKGQDP